MAISSSFTSPASVIQCTCTNHQHIEEVAVGKPLALAFSYETSEGLGWFMGHCPCLHHDTAQVTLILGTCWKQYSSSSSQRKVQNFASFAFAPWSSVPRSITDVSTVKPPLGLTISTFILAIDILWRLLHVPAWVRMLLTFWFVKPAIQVLVKFLSDCKLASYSDKLCSRERLCGTCLDWDRTGAEVSVMWSCS